MQTANAAHDQHLAQPHGAHPHLAHHFQDAEQQFDAGRLGMWLFLATEVLLFGGLFCFYAVLRRNHPGVFAWGHHFLDRTLGGFNTVILISSSVTMAWAVRCAQLGQRGRLALMLSLTLLGGFGFMGIKYVEYSSKVKHGLLWGNHFKPDPEYVAAHFGAAAEAGRAPDEDRVTRPGDAELGKEAFLGTCAQCHAKDGRGMPGQGKDLRTSEFVTKLSDAELLDFVKVGRQPWDPANATGVMMPPRGGNMALCSQDLADIIAHVRELQKAYKESPEAAGAAPQDVGEVDPVSLIATAPPGPPGLAAAALSPAKAAMVQPPNAHLFFSAYFLMTGLHGLHVLAGMMVIVWLLLGAVRGRFGAAYFTPVDLGGLYWHLVDLIWIFLFPLLYLIH
ncbi:MAG: cytochrome c oxidase subunit 3 [Planctomycetota bacterium]